MNFEDYPYENSLEFICFLEKVMGLTKSEKIHKTTFMLVLHRLLTCAYAEDNCSMHQFLTDCKDSYELTLNVIKEQE